MYEPDYYDAARFARLLRTSHRVSTRVELWAEGNLLTTSAAFLDGEVADTWVVAGVRRNLNLTVPPSKQWLAWLRLPLLEARPFRGVEHSESSVVECPLGRFPILQPEMSNPLGPVKIDAADYYQRVIQADFSYPVKTGPRYAVDAINDLLTNWAHPFAGVRTTSVTSSETGIARGTVYDKTRHDAIVTLAKSFGLEVFLDRVGVPTIADSRTRLSAQTDATGVGTESSVVSPDWSKVYNQVSVTSSAQDVSFPAQVAVVSVNHPAAQWRIGARVLKFASPVLTTPAQAANAAQTILKKAAGQSLVHTYTTVPDPRRDAGDSIKGATKDGGVGTYQIQSVTHPLTVDGRQRITTVDTQLDYSEDFA